MGDFAKKRRSGHSVVILKILSSVVEKHVNVYFVFLIRIPSKYNPSMYWI